MAPALEVLVEAEAKGLSASTVSRLKQQWRGDYEAWRHRRLDKDRWVYVWADGIYSGLRADRQRLCALVIVGVNDRGDKHFLAIEDGIRESTQSWREVLLDLKARGMNGPEVAVGDGALGFWASLDEVFPAIHQQRCWLHKTGNVLNALPKSVQPKAKSALHDIWIESTFATIRHRTNRARGCVTRDSLLHMMFKLGECAQQNWRKLRGFKYLAKVIEGVTFVDGEEIDQPNQVAA